MQWNWVTSSVSLVTIQEGWCGTALGTWLSLMLDTHWWLQRYVRSDSSEGGGVIMCLCAQGGIYLVCHGLHRGQGGHRLVAEIVTRDEASGTLRVSGVSRVESGLSFPVPNAPVQYRRAMAAAVTGGCGVLAIGPSMAAEEAMPWSLKEAFLSGQSVVAIPHSTCVVTNSCLFEFLNESHLIIHQFHTRCRSVRVTCLYSRGFIHSAMQVGG